MRCRPNDPSTARHQRCSNSRSSHSSPLASHPAYYLTFTPEQMMNECLSTFCYNEEETASIINKYMAIGYTNPPEKKKKKKKVPSQTRKLQSPHLYRVVQHSKHNFHVTVSVDIPKRHGVDPVVGLDTAQEL